MAFSHNGLTWATTNEHSRDVIQEKLIKIAKDSQRLPLFKDCRNLSNYWLQIHIPSLILQPPTTITRFSSYHLFRDSWSRKQRRANKAFRVIFESASQGDSREIPPKPLTPRKMFEFPKGTSFKFDENLLHEFLKGNEIIPKGMNEEVAALKINGREHKFSFFDFTMVLPHLTEESRTAMAKDPIRAQWELLVRMYALRYPYEESEDHPPNSQEEP